VGQAGVTGIVIGFPEHPASGRLALLALCGDLVIAVDAMAIREIRRTAETVTRPIAPGVIALDLDTGLVPGSDLGELFGLGTQTTAWVVVDLPGIARPLAFRIGRCFMVEPLPVCRAIPRGIFATTSRSDAIVAGFSVAALPGLAGHVSGVVVDLARVLTERELASMTALAGDEREAALDT
jgi:hypothetical protein